MADPVFVGMPRRLVSIDVDGRDVEVLEGSTILEACRRLEIDTPTLCQLDNRTPINVCRVCVVELEGSRVLVPACSRKVEAGMKIRTDSERVRHSRRLVLELLGSSVDMSVRAAGPGLDDSLRRDALTFWARCCDRGAAGEGRQRAV